MGINYKELLEDFNDIPGLLDIIDSLDRHPTKAYKSRSLRKIKRIVVHTTDWATGPRRIARYDVEPNHISSTGCPAITYHEMIGGSGEPYKTLDYEEVSWHSGVWNSSSVAIALSYRCSNKKGEDVYKPKRKLMKALHLRCGEMCLSFGLTPDRVVGHRELKGTGWILFKGSKKLRKTCPGIHVDLDLLRVNVSKYMQIVLGADDFYHGAVDGIFGPKSMEALALYKRSEKFKCLEVR